MGMVAARSRATGAGTAIAFVIAGAFGCAAGGNADDDGPDLAADSGETDAGMTPSSPTANGGTGADGRPAEGSAAEASATDGNGGTTLGSCDPIPWARDEDGDGYGDPATVANACVAPPRYVADATDCNDGDATIHPNASETCGGPDKDCDFIAPPLCNSCDQLLASGNGDTTGLYTIDVDGDVGAVPPSQVWCDQETDGGGWTLVQRTVWNPAQTDAMRTGFATWEGQTLGNPSPGQAFRLQGNAWGPLNLQLDHLLVHELRQQDGETCAPLFYLGVGGELTVSTDTALLTGLQADVAMVGGTELSTTDSGPSTTCMTTGNAVPWFYELCCSTCPVFQSGYWNEPHPMVDYTQTVPDFHGNLETDVCSGPVILSINPNSVYRGVEQMSYFLR